MKHINLGAIPPTHPRDPVPRERCPRCRRGMPGACTPRGEAVEPFQRQRSVGGTTCRSGRALNCRCHEVPS